jgi:hypothetical protein
MGGGAHSLHGVSLRQGNVSLPETRVHVPDVTPETLAKAISEVIFAYMDYMDHLIQNAEKTTAHIAQMKKDLQ